MSTCVPFFCREWGEHCCTTRNVVYMYKPIVHVRVHVGVICFLCFVGGCDGDGAFGDNGDAGGGVSCDRVMVKDCGVR